MSRRVLGGMFWTMLAGVVMACGESPIENDPAVAPFVGIWDADSLTLTNLADTVVADVLGNGGSFFIRVEASGLYTATLAVFGSPNVQIGQLSVSGATLTLTPTQPPGEPATSSDFRFVTADYLVLDGPTEFDFNFDGTPEPAQAHFELQRR